MAKAATSDQRVDKKLLMKRTSNILIVAALAGGSFLAACSTDHRKPGKHYMPDMVDSRAYEFYNKTVANMKPVEGTVKRGELLPYTLKAEDTAQANLVKNPLSITATDLEEGKRLFNIYCAVCHGAKLDGNGPLYKDGNGPYPAAPPSFISGKLTSYSEGRIFHVATYGYNVMGSYASQLDREQRWKVVAYIKNVQNGGKTPAATSDSTAVAVAAAPADSAATK